MMGNAAFVAVLHFVSGKAWLRRVLALLVAAAAKFAVLFLLVKYAICGIFADALMGQGLLKAPMLTALPATFGVTQLFTALIGGTLAILLVPVLKKALHRN